MTERGNGVRKELRRLILDGLKGRTLKALLEQLIKRFNERGETLSKECFRQWVEGYSFPSNKHRQTILAEVVGGPCGEAIKQLRGPAFRGWRRRVMKETEESMTTAHGGPRNGRTNRLFPHVQHRGDDGRTHMRPMIICVECDARETCVRNGTEEAEEKFRKKGWEVGKDNSHDYCPMCVKARGERAKVVKMEDHVKNNGTAEPAIGTPPPPEMSREEGRILSRLIEDRWDEEHARYKPGWSDAALAKEVGKPVEWVKQRRELDFGGSGEDPGVEEFIRTQVALNQEMDALKIGFDELVASVSALTGDHAKVARMLEKYRDGHNALASKANILKEVAAKLSPFVPAERKAG